MSKVILTILFLGSIFGLLVFQRLDFTPRRQVVVLSSRASEATVRQSMQEGETIRTEKNEFLAVQIGNARIYLDESTHLELKSLDAARPRLKFGHGRLIVDDQSGYLEIHTPVAEHVIQSGKAMLIGYDFDAHTTIVPLSGSINTYIPLTNERFTQTTPFDLKTTNPPIWRNVTHHPETDTRRVFTNWVRTTH